MELGWGVTNKADIVKVNQNEVLLPKGTAIASVKPFVHRLLARISSAADTEMGFENWKKNLDSARLVAM